jgi:GTPase SAR1 family protein
MESNNNSNEIKTILVGQSGVGKTCLINTCAGFEFDSIKRNI